MSESTYNDYVTTPQVSILLENIPRFQKAKELGYKGFCDYVRSERNTLLAKTDWWAASDRTMTAEETAYRQALRDITGQVGFPTNITWPTKPE